MMDDRASATPPLYLLPGMDRGYPVYARLAPLLPGAVVLDYVAPEQGETLVEYARRMAAGLERDCYVGGTSLGGIVALEMARVLRPRGCIVIASVTHPRQLPPWFSIWRPLGGRVTTRLMSLTAASAAVVPHPLRTRSTIRVSSWNGTNAKWHRWATASVLDWQPDPSPLPCPLLHIHGDADATFPIRYVDADVVILGGRHNLPASHPLETAQAIAAFTRAVGQVR